MRRIGFILFLLITGLMSQAQSTSYEVAVLKYNGGGDWYANPTSMPNLVKFCNKNLDMNINKEVATVEVGSPDLFNYPFVHMTGHGNVVFSDQDAKNLRKYLVNGGFLHIDDNYGMDKFIRNELKKVFPNLELIELPHDNPIYHQKYEFQQGPPKVHEHDGKAPQGYGIIYEGRLVLYYTVESDLGDGWEDQDVHNDSEATRMKALKMGSNILQYALTGGI